MADYTAEQLENQARLMERDHADATAIAMLRQAAQMMRRTMSEPVTDEEVLRACEAYDQSASLALNADDTVNRMRAALESFAAGRDRVPHTGLYFAADPANGDFDVYATLDEARKGAEVALDYAREDACDSGWPDDPPQICYGVILGQCVEISREASTEGTSFSEIADFELRAFASAPEPPK